MYNYICCFTGVIFLLLGCAETESNKICKENNEIRACNKKEEMMIDGINAIIQTVYHFDPSSISRNFFGADFNAGNSPKVIFLGENHADVIGQMETLGAINYLATDGGILLSEGLGRSVRDALPCDLRLLFRIYRHWQWEKMGRVYDHIAQSDWVKNEGLIDALIATKDSYNLSMLNLSKLECGFWDDEKALKEQVSRKSVIKRNESMTIAINDALKNHKHGPIMLVSGFLHMPSGELLIAKRLNSEPEKHQIYEPVSLQKYYEDVKDTFNGLKNMKINQTSGTTEIIYQFLTRNNISFKELIHKRMLSII